MLTESNAEGAIALCTKKSNTGKGGKPVDEEQSCCVEEINCRAGKSLSMTIMINFTLLTKSNARKAQSILDGEEQFCCAEEVANAGQAKSTLDDHLEEIFGSDDTKWKAQSSLHK